ncbi:454_t:CDS:2 [Ambispora leptoticha]|uniref:454_t:CDS:1 n=1 Tax=Ambispora leptoticha TaxID=144679 RepID=A0A9N8Z891_9GLOM|nr:454_t:CDS:2 [Ambispora leptoticha]
MNEKKAAETEKIKLENKITKEVTYEKLKAKAKHENIKDKIQIFQELVALEEKLKSSDKLTGEEQKKLEALEMLKKEFKTSFVEPEKKPLAESTKKLLIKKRVVILVLDLKLNEEKLSSLLENIKGEIENQKEKNKDLGDKIALSLDKNESLIKLRLENLSSELKNSVAQPLAKINNVLLHPRERGKLGNLQLDQLLSLYLPKNGKVYQLEFTLKKKRTNGEGLRVDAIVFGIDGKNNLAIDSKFPLENYLMLFKEELSDVERKEIEKNFKNNLKEHIKKVAEYVSELDGTDHAIMFVPSEQWLLIIFSEQTKLGSNTEM